MSVAQRLGSPANIQEYYLHPEHIFQKNSVAYHSVFRRKLIKKKL